MTGKVILGCPAVHWYGHHLSFGGRWWFNFLIANCDLILFMVYQQVVTFSYKYMFAVSSTKQKTIFQCSEIMAGIYIMRIYTMKCWQEITMVKVFTEIMNTVTTVIKRVTTVVILNHLQ